LQLSGLDTSLLQDMPLPLLPEFGIVAAERVGRFTGIAPALLRLEAAGWEGVAFRAWPSVCAVKKQNPAFRGAVGGEASSNASPGARRWRPKVRQAAPEARPAWPPPLVQFLVCLASSPHDQVLGVLVSVVEAMCRAVDTAASEGEAVKRQKKIWRRLCGLVNVIGRRQGREPGRSATTIRPAHWENAER